MPEHLIPTNELIGAWVFVGLTLLIFSFLYKDNPLFKIGEHLYVVEIDAASQEAADEEVRATVPDTFRACTPPPPPC